MPIYIWKGTNSYGEKRSGKIEAPDERVVHAHLKKLRITPSKVQEAPKDLFENVEFLKPKVTGKDLVIFIRMLSTMIDAGLPIIQCLDILYSQQENKTFKTMNKQKLPIILASAALVLSIFAVVLIYSPSTSLGSVGEKPRVGAG